MKAGVRQTFLWFAILALLPEALGLLTDEKDSQDWLSHWRFSAKL